MRNLPAFACLRFSRGCSGSRFCVGHNLNEPQKSSVQNFHAPMSFGRGYPKPPKNHGFSVENGCHKILVSFHFSGDRLHFSTSAFGVFF